jgi:hypothetical protein
MEGLRTSRPQLGFREQLNGTSVSAAFRYVRGYSQ